MPLARQPVQISNSDKSSLSKASKSPHQSSPNHFHAANKKCTTEPQLGSVMASTMFPTVEVEIGLPIRFSFACDVHPQHSHEETWKLSPSNPCCSQPHHRPSHRCGPTSPVHRQGTENRRNEDVTFLRNAHLRGAFSCSVAGELVVLRPQWLFPKLAPSPTH